MSDAAEIPAISAAGLTKRYGNGVLALRSLDLEVKAGEVFCLLGPNGAGKTTLTRILATQLAPSSGSTRIFGLDVDRDVSKVRRQLAVVPQQSFPDIELKVWEHILYYLVARGMGWSEARRATRRVVDQLGLGDKYSELVRTLSGGMRRRVLLAMTLASRARLMLLDEPTSGLDIIMRRDVWSSLVRLKNESTAVLTTHSMEEAETLADRIGIMAEGELIACGTPNELRALAPGQDKVVFQEAALPRATLERYGYVQEYAGKWAVFPSGSEAKQCLLNAGIKAQVEASLLHTTLEDVFVYLVGDRRGRLEMERLG